MLAVRDHFDRSTIIVLLSALLLAILCILPNTQAITPLWMIKAGLDIGDTIFHEMGHALFGWATGHASLPALNTLFNREHASGVTLIGHHNWFILIFAFVIMSYYCFRLYEHGSPYFYEMVGFIIIVGAFILFSQSDLLIHFGGHGGAMLMGGFFLYRGILNLDSRNGYERWLNALFGWYLILSNIHFCYQLITTPYVRDRYVNALMHHDFSKISEYAHSWTLDGVCIFGICFGVVTIIGAFAYALFRESWEEYAT